MYIMASVSRRRYLFLELAVLTVTTTEVAQAVEVVDSGWNAELYRTDGTYLNVKDAENNTVESSRSTALYKELNGECCWPAVPKDENGNKVFEGFFAQFEGFLDVPKSGEYQFRVDSDDGALLSIDGKVVSFIFKMRVSPITSLCASVAGP